MEKYHQLTHEIPIESDYLDLGDFTFYNGFSNVPVNLFLKKPELSSETVCEEIVLFINDGDNGEATGCYQRQCRIVDPDQ